MTKKRVAVIASAQDQHASYVVSALERRGASVLLVETGRVPESMSLSWEQGETFYDGICLNELESFYLKAVHLSLPTLDPGHFSERNLETWHEQYVAERERHSLIASVLRALSEAANCFINPLPAVDLHFLKLYQLSLLARAGISVPASLGTSDPEAISAFAAKYDNVIYKPLAGGALVRRLQPEHLEPERLALLRNAPVLFQEEVRGEEYRAYVLGGEPIAAFSIPTEGAVDARLNLEKVRPTTLSSTDWELCIRATEALNLTFSAVDLRRRADGELIVLECNPTPAVAFFEDPEHGTIIQRLADYLFAAA